MKRTAQVQYIWLERLKVFADRAWYAPLIGALAAADQFVILIPIEWLMLPSVLMRPKRWLSTAFWVTTGCALGALAMAMLADRYGIALIEHWAPRILESSEWAHSTRFIQDKGAWALMLVAMGPIPQHPAVVLSGLAHMPAIQVFGAVWSGRMIKYCALMYLASHAPSLLARYLPKMRAILANRPIQSQPSHDKKDE